MKEQKVTHNKLSIIFLLVILLLLMAILSEGCGVYFNTFFNCRKAFNAAEKVRKNSQSGHGGTNNYNVAIEKARKVVENHPNSKYYDDAVYILGVSYFHTEQYSRAERRFRELLANYEDSKFVREATLYLAKTKLQLHDINDAIVIFEEIFSADYDRAFKSEAAMALGEFQFEEGDYELSRNYFMAVRDSLGDDLQKREAQIYIADGLFESFRFGDALGAYLQVLGMDPDKNERFHALFQAAISSYRLLKLDDGQSYLATLIEDELYFDSISSLRLRVAEGYEYEDDLILAEEAYADVAATAEKKNLQSQAYYRLGLIYQYDYDDLEAAKGHYDQAVEVNRNSEWGREALQRSSAIGKIKRYARRLDVDSVVTQEQIDEAAYTQYLLAELYWLDLNKPDTAILEMQYVIDSFPGAFDSPKAMIALSQMYREHHEDDQAADSILRQVLEKFPRSDFIPEALEALGLIGTDADTGYAERYFRWAEDFLVDSAEYDSARYYYQFVADSFPDSKYFLQARFNTIWLTEMYQSPGDSSLIFAYEEFVDSFPGTPLAREAGNRLRAGTVSSRESRDILDRGDEREDLAPSDTSARGGDTATGYIDPLVALYNGPEGERLTTIDDKPTEIEYPFEFPEEAFTMKEDGFFLYFHIKLDFSGKVIDNVLKIPSQYEEVNRLAILTVASMSFDPLEISQLISLYDLQESSDGEGHWMVYKYLVEKPDFLK